MAERKGACTRAMVEGLGCATGVELGEALGCMAKRVRYLYMWGVYERKACGMKGGVTEKRKEGGGSRGERRWGPRGWGGGKGERRELLMEHLTALDRGRRLVDIQYLLRNTDILQVYIVYNT